MLADLEMFLLVVSCEVIEVSRSEKKHMEHICIRNIAQESWQCRGFQGDTQYTDTTTDGGCLGGWPEVKAKVFQNNFTEEVRPRRGFPGVLVPPVVASAPKIMVIKW